MRAAAPALALLLAACGGGGADADGDGNITQVEARKEAEKVELEPGRWETTIKVSDAKLGGVPLPQGANPLAEGRTNVACISKEQAANPDANIFAGDQPQGCTYDRFAMSGGKIDAAVNCAVPGQPARMSMTMAGEYSGTSYRLVTDSRITGGGPGLPPGAAITSRAEITGRRLGDC